MAQNTHIDFDGEPVALVRAAFKFANDSMGPRRTRWKREYEIFNTMIDMTNRDPEQANVFIPKVLNIIRQKHPGDVRAIAGSRPYFPFTSKQAQFRQGVKAWESYADDLVGDSGYFANVVMAALLKICYGTSFMEFTPYFSPTGRMQLTRTPQGIAQIPQFRLKLASRVYAPWEVRVDPYARNLEEPNGCRYVVKLLPCSKREVLRMAAMGAYPQLDVEKFNELGQGGNIADEWGWEILSGVGLSEPAMDGDMGVILRFESPERYIDLWNGSFLMRENPDPILKKINLARWSHNYDAHTKNMFWGEGEIKPQEILQDILNSLNSQGINSFNIATQPVIYYRQGKIEKDDLLYSMYQRIPIKTQGEEQYPLSHYVMESFGHELPNSHWLMTQKTERQMDEIAGQPAFQRGEMTGDEKLATEIMKADEYGNDRKELNVRLGEEIFLNQLGGIMIDIVTKAATPPDLLEHLNPQEVLAAMMMNPKQIPGGTIFQFRGSARVAKQILKQRNWERLAKLMFGNRQVLQGRFLEWSLRVHEEDTPEVLEMIIPDDVFMRLQAMQQAREQEQEQQTGRIPQRKSEAKMVTDEASRQRAEARG
jgi:hypothetical protein